MINRGDIIWLGVAAGTSGGLIGGIMLGLGMDLVANGQPLGLILVIPGAPASALVGWLMARRLARQVAEPDRQGFVERRGQYHPSWRRRKED